MISPFLLLAARLMVGPPIAVEGEAACPTADAVKERVAALLPERATSLPDRARIEVAGDGTTTIRLVTPDGAVIGARTLPATGSCEERARSIAVILGTWESDIHPEFQQRRERAAARAAVGGQTAPAAGTPAVAVPVSSRPGPLSRPEPPAVARADLGHPLPRPAVVPWEVGAGVLAGWAGDQWKPGAQLVAAAFPGGRWGARLTLQGDEQRTITAGGGQGQWSRRAAALGPAVRLVAARWMVEAHLSAEMGWFTVQGANYPVTYRGTGVDGGVAAGLRLVGPGGHFRPWVAVDGGRWLGGRTVRELVQGQEEPVPAWTASATVGVGFFGP